MVACVSLDSEALDGVVPLGILMFGYRSNLVLPGTGALPVPLVRGRAHIKKEKSMMNSLINFVVVSSVRSYVPKNTLTTHSLTTWVRAPQAYVKRTFWESSIIPGKIQNAGACM